MSQEPIGKPALSITRIIDESIESIRKQKPEKKRDPKPRATLEGMALSENGEPARDIEIHLLGLDSPSNYWGCTDARGRYSVNALPGNYVACVLYRGGIGLCRDFALRKERKTQSDLHLAFFTRVEPGDLLRRLPTGSGGSIFSSIEGAVFHGQAPVPGINVEIRPLGKTPAEPLATITFLQGRYSLTAPPGEYTVCVVYRGASRLCRIASLRQGRRIVSDFNLEDLDE
ncbi:MAG TPA: hypothetical protein VFY29_09710 [Terriglobia bacterium]|nr:hypothetical protein [Terriglobia bacterium]